MDKVLKQRLIGASILIALAVIFVPMFFDGPEQQQVAREMTIDLPSAPDDRGQVRRLPLDPERTREATPDSRARPPAQSQSGRSEDGFGQDRSAGESSPTADELMDDIEQSSRRSRSAPESSSSESAAPEPVDEPAVAEPDSEPPEEIAAIEPETVSPPEDEIADQPAESSPEPSANDTASGWVVQVASFSARTNAEEVSVQLTSLGHVASIDLIVRGQSELHRVRTGPYDSREAADRARNQIEQTVAGVDPVVMGGPTIELPAAPTEAGYAVQVGSFASRNNALRLLDQLNDQGYDAFIHEDAAGSRTIWRVRVGPLGSRAEAQQRLDDLIERAGMDGLVVSHP